MKKTAAVLSEGPKWGMCSAAKMAPEGKGITSMALVDDGADAD